MGKDNVVDFPVDFESEIALAERSHDLILERMARGRLPEDTVPSGDVSALIDAIGELLHLAALESDGQKISQKKMERALERLRSAVDQIVSWPLVPRTLVTAPLVEAFEELELEWLALEFMTTLPNLDFLNAEECEAAVSAFRRILPAHMRMAMAEDEWVPEFEDLVRNLRELTLDEMDNDELHSTLRKAVIFHAIHGRQELQKTIRGTKASSEPLPDNLAAALDELSGEAFESELIHNSMHLVLADAVAAGLLPGGAAPRPVVAALYYAFVERDDEDYDLDLLRIAKWARIKPQKLRKLVAQLDQVFDWAPPDLNELVEARQQNRWKIYSALMEFSPVRWLPDREGGIPPYSADAARARLEDLREVVWMMIDGWEAVRFVSESFRYGGDAPEEIDEEILLEAVRLWKRDRLVDSEMIDEDLELEDDWDDEVVESDFDFLWKELGLEKGKQ